MDGSPVYHIHKPGHDGLRRKTSSIIKNLMISALYSTLWHQPPVLPFPQIKIPKTLASESDNVIEPPPDRQYIPIIPEGPFLQEAKTLAWKPLTKECSR